METIISYYSKLAPPKFIYRPELWERQQAHLRFDTPEERNLFLACDLLAHVEDYRHSNLLVVFCGYRERDKFSRYLYGCIQHLGLMNLDNCVPSLATIKVGSSVIFVRLASRSLLLSLSVDAAWVSGGSPKPIVDLIQEKLSLSQHGTLVTF